MRKNILSIPITLDGYIEGPNRERDWVIADDELHDYHTHLLENADLVLFGRVTYELLANYWPTATSDPSLPAGMRRFAEAINPMPKVVFSKTLSDVGWNTKIAKSIDPQEIKELEKQAGGNMVLLGGATTTQTFIQHGLMDELQLLVHPVAIGSGKPLLGDIHSLQKLDFLRRQVFQSGVVALCYQPDGKV